MAKATAEARRPLAIALVGPGAISRGAPNRHAATPNQISLLSIAWAALRGALLRWNRRWPAFIMAAVCVQIRLLCNLLDGMVAIEGGKSTATGALFNEIPDRLADPPFLVPLGYAAGHPWLGWLTALLAVLTAYVSVLAARSASSKILANFCQSNGEWRF